MASTTWTAAATVFFGGTQAALALRGRRVRTAGVLMSCPVYDPINPGSQRTIDLGVGREGFVANASGDRILVAFTADSQQVPKSLDALIRQPLGSFNVVAVNWPTFRLQFAIQL